MSKKTPVDHHVEHENPITKGCSASLPSLFSCSQLSPTSSDKLLSAALELVHPLISNFDAIPCNHKLLLNLFDHDFDKNSLNCYHHLVLFMVLHQKNISQLQK